MTGLLERIGKKVLLFLQIVGEMLILLGKTLYSFREAPRNIHSIFAQMAIIGYETLPVASVMAFFVGMVLALQSFYGFRKFGAESELKFDTP